MYEDELGHRDPQREGSEEDAVRKLKRLPKIKDNIVFCLENLRPKPKIRETFAHKTIKANVDKCQLGCVKKIFYEKRTFTSMK